MTTKPIDDAPPVEQAAPVLGPAFVPPDLESRINTRRNEIIARLVELKAERRIVAGKARDQLKAKLSELRQILKQGVVDGWASLGDIAKKRLEHWLAN